MLSVPISFFRPPSTTLPSSSLITLLLDIYCYFCFSIPPSFTLIHPITFPLAPSSHPIHPASLTSHEDRFHSMPVTSSLISLSGVLRSNLTSAGMPCASLIARLFSSFCRPYDRFLGRGQINLLCFLFVIYCFLLVY